MLDLSPDRAEEVLDMVSPEELSAWKAADGDGYAAVMEAIAKREATASRSED